MTLYLNTALPFPLPGATARPGLVSVLRSSSSCASPVNAVATKKRTLEDMQLDNSFVRELPGDAIAKNELRQVFGAFYSRVEPTPTASDPSLIAFSDTVLELLELDEDEVHRPEFSLVFSGQTTLPGNANYAQCYGGHQARNTFFKIINQFSFSYECPFFSYRPLPAIRAHFAIQFRHTKKHFLTVTYLSLGCTRPLSSVLTFCPAVRAVGRAARGRPRYHAGGAGQRPGGAVGNAAQGVRYLPWFPY